MQRLQQGIRNDQVLADGYRAVGVVNMANFMLARIQIATAELKAMGVSVGQQPQP